MNLSNPAKAALVGILVIVILGILSTVANATVQCAPESAVLEGLASKFGETPIFSGPTESGSRIVITVNSAKGTWTALTLQGGLACIRASGLSFSTMPGKPNA